MNEGAGNNLFVLQGFDSVTATVCVEWRVRIGEVDRLRSILSPESSDDPDLECSYFELSEQDMRKIGRLCRPPIRPHRIFTGISRPYLAFDAIPYLIHTNFELPLMLEGRKPLAAFCNSYPADWLEEFLAPFEPFVASGQLVRRIIDMLTPYLKQRRPEFEGMRHVLFALPGSEWRINAYIDNIINETRDWDDGLERLQGFLLGYEDWQNDWWIRQRTMRREAAGQ